VQARNANSECARRFLFSHTCTHRRVSRSETEAVTSDLEAVREDEKGKMKNKKEKGKKRKGSHTERLSDKSTEIEIGKTAKSLERELDRN